MFANDINLPVTYSSAIQNINQKENDIFISFQDNDNVYDKNRVISVWPHYQNRYCFVYSNAKVMAFLELSFSSFSATNMLFIAFCIFWFYHSYILYAR